ncbi:MAG: hypothetical protein HQ581_27780 [Planctomycetes bacterium]|nr:hypothetical protein [Planctomycetota bacterium]
MTDPTIHWATDSPGQQFALPEGAGEARLIVSEPTGRWAVALRRHLTDASVGVHQTRSLTDAWDVLRACPASFLVVEVTRGSVRALLERMARLPGQFPLARIAVVADRRLHRWQWLFREAGAIHFVSSSRCLAPLAEAAINHLARAPRRWRSLTERLWDGLPWSPAG